jgi:hypothetical protein
LVCSKIFTTWYVMLKLLTGYESHFEGWRLRCTSEESCFSQSLSKGEIFVPMVGCIMLKQLNVPSATCWIKCFIASMLLKGLLEKDYNKLMCWIWMEFITNLRKDLLESLSYRISFKIQRTATSVNRRLVQQIQVPATIENL